MTATPENFLNNRKWRIFLRIVAVLVGIAIGSFLVFQILFLYRVLPHGGIW
ncbi:MAG TPA: hypothetical protein VJB59_08310 [Bdellovibrionota bacterium]|nr:hypothetical protein [Bdellovibrionota bacterium]